MVAHDGRQELLDSATGSGFCLLATPAAALALAADGLDRQLAAAAVHVVELAAADGDGSSSRTAGIRVADVTGTYRALAGRTRRQVRSRSARDFYAYGAGQKPMDAVGPRPASC